MPIKFLQRDSNRHSKLGHLRKKKQKWRRPTGRDNKMREKRRGYPKVVSIGYSKDKSVRGTIEGKKPIVVLNVKDLETVKNNLIIIGAVGNKKKIEILKKAKEMKIEIYNINEKKFMKEIEKKKKVKKLKKKIVDKKIEKKKEVKKEEPKKDVKTQTKPEETKK